VNENAEPEAVIAARRRRAAGRYRMRFKGNRHRDWKRTVACPRRVLGAKPTRPEAVANRLWQPQFGTLPPAVARTGP
jgi:hypothetical protein